MAHCPFEDLADLAEDLDVVRSWEGIKEPNPGKFYIRGKGFLHFHTKDGARWADARTGAEWGPKLDIPYGCLPKVRRQFLNQVRVCYDATIAALSPSRPASRT